MKRHEIKLDGYGAHTTLAEDRPIMLLGTAESYGIETLHVVHGESWEGLTITATFNAPDGTSTDMLMNADGSITVPSEATAKSGSGKIVFTGVSDGVQRISCDLEYFVVAHSAINGVQSGGTTPSWFEQAATRFMPPGGTAGQVLTKLTDTDFDAEWQNSQGGAGLAPLVGTTQTVTPSQVFAAIKAGRDVALQHNTNLIMGTFMFSAFNANETQGAVVSNLILPQLEGITGTLVGSVANDEWTFAVKNMATKDDVNIAVNEALAAAKASGEFDGADGLTPTIGENGNWYLGDTDTGKPSRGDKGDTGAKGEKGDKGDTGETGATGAAGAAGKSAYAYAQDGGYTGTEEQFAAKLAQEKFANPNALTFTGAVTGSYDGSAPVSVKIPEGGSGEAWELINSNTLSENVTAVTFDFDTPYKKILFVCQPNVSVNGWKRFSINNGIDIPCASASISADHALFIEIGASEKRRYQAKDNRVLARVRVTVEQVLSPQNGILDTYDGNMWVDVAGAYFGNKSAIEINSIAMKTANMCVAGAYFEVWGVKA